MVLTSGDYDHISLSDGQGFGVVGDGTGALSHNQYLVARMLVEFVPRTSVKCYDREVEIVAVFWIQDGLPPDLSSVIRPPLPRSFISALVLATLLIVTFFIDSSSY